MVSPASPGCVLAGIASVSMGPLSHRYFFVVEEDNTPLSVTVTPCDTPLEWKLSLRELPEEASGESSGGGDLGEGGWLVKRAALRW